MTPPARAEIVVVGGGPAGSTAAAVLAAAGRDVVLLERDTFPRDKLCGEFLSGDAEQWLARIDALDAIRALAPPTIEEATFVVPSGRRARIALPSPGIGVSRLRLDEALFDAAKRAGAQTFTNTAVVNVTASSVEVSGGPTIAADLVICAHGRRARLDKALLRDFTADRHPYVALKRHHEGGAELDGHIELYVFDGGYCGASRVEGGTLNMCMLLEERFVKAQGGADWDTVTAALAREHPAFAERLRSMTPTRGPVAVAQIPFVEKERTKGGVLFTGDAAAMIAPLTGDGQAMAIESGVMLADLVAAGPADLPAAWDRAWKKRFGVRLRLAHELQRGLLKPRTARLLVGAVDTVPPLGRALARLTRSVR